MLNISFNNEGRHFKFVIRYVNLMSDKVSKFPDVTDHAKHVGPRTFTDKNAIGPVKVVPIMVRLSGEDFTRQWSKKSTSARPRRVIFTSGRVHPASHSSNRTSAKIIEISMQSIAANANLFRKIIPKLPVSPPCWRKCQFD